MEQPKARLTLQQHQQAINEAIWIDASPHEWPTVDKMWLLCSALIDSVQMVDFLRAQLAAVEAERDAARAGEARAVEALEAEQRAAHWRNLARITDKHEDHLEATRLSEIAQNLRHGVVLVGNPPALAWLAQQRREAAAEELERLAKDRDADTEGEEESFFRGIMTTEDCRQRAAALRQTGVQDA